MVFMFIPTTISLAALLLCAGSAAASQQSPMSDQITSPEISGQEAIQIVNNSVSLAYDSTHLNYGEPSDGAIADKYYDTEYGTLSRGGFSGSVSAMKSYRFLRDIYFQASFGRAAGDVSYNGHTMPSLLNPTSLPINQISGAQINDWGLRLGKGFEAGSRWLFTPYLAYGYHTWARTLGMGTAGSYTENYQHNAIELGNMIQYAPTSKIVLTADGQFGTTFWAHIQAPQYQVNSDLGAAPAAQVDLEADYALWRFFHAFISWRYAHFSYGQSGVAPSGFLEPASNTDLQTYLAGLRFCF
jgi:hypothetical protein